MQYLNLLYAEKKSVKPNDRIVQVFVKLENKFYVQLPSRYVDSSVLKKYDRQVHHNNIRNHLFMKLTTLTCVILIKK